MVSVSVIIVSYNTAELTKQCLDSLLAEIQQSSLLRGKTEVWVVDNNSSDNSIAVLQEIGEASSIPMHLILNKDNKGFAAANNQAIKASKSELVFLLNSDTIVQPGSLNHLVESMITTPSDAETADLASYSSKLDHLGILASELINPDSTHQSQGGSFPNLLSLACHMLMLDDLPIIGQWLPSTQHTGRRAHNTSSTELIQKDWVAATAVLIKREMLEEVGLLDEKIFMYGEDVELCLRAKAHHWDIAIDPQAKITHFGSASSSSSRAILGELTSYLYIWAKHKPDWQFPLVKLLIRIGARLRIWVFGTIVQQPERVAAYQEVLKSIKIHNRP